MYVYMATDLPTLLYNILHIGLLSYRHLYMYVRMYSPALLGAGSYQELLHCGGLGAWAAGTDPVSLYGNVCSSAEVEAGPQLGPYRGWEGKGCGRYVSRGGVNAQHHGGTNYTKQYICEAQYMAVTLPWFGPP